MTVKPPIGSRKMIDPALGGRFTGRIYEIVEHKQVNAVGRDVQTGERLRAKFHMWVDVPADATVTASDSDAAVVVAAVTSVLPALPTASFVMKSTAPSAVGWRVPDDAIFVVLQDRGDRVKLARAGGGDGTRYWPGVPRAWVTRVELDLTLKTTEETIQEN